jgi:D-alanyl-D-alanine dipeptidase
MLSINADAAQFNLKKHPTLTLAKSKIKDLEVELKYATTDNFVKKILYEDLNDCFLQKPAVEMLQKADVKLKELNSKLRFHAFDCVRPRSVQIEMWNKVKGTAQQNYVGDPYSKDASVHSYGCAIDLSIANKDTGLIDMGTPFDFFGPEAEPKFEIQQMAKGKLTSVQIQNRLLLRLAMLAGGFSPISNEWWHFNCASPAKTRERFQVIE